MAKPSATVIFSLGLALVYTVLFMQARVMFSGVDEAMDKSAALEMQVEREKIRTAMVRMQFEEFRSYVASLLPKKIPVNTEEHYPLRQLASVLKSSDSYRVKLVRANSLMLQGKQSYDQGEYLEASKSFKKILEFYSFSQHIIEAHFLYSESLFKMGDIESSAAVIKRMIELFPDDELTGYAMIRLGRIFESQRRSTEALDVYNTVLSSFPQRGLASEASQAIQELRL